MIPSLLKRIENLASARPDQAAVIYKKETLTYTQLYRKAIGIGAWLRLQGVSSGDRVCFSAVSRPETVAVYLGCQSIGAVAVFLDRNAIPDNMARISRIAEARLLLTDKKMTEREAGCPVFPLRKVYDQAEEQAPLPEAEKNGQGQILAEVSEEDISELIFTSGTTGKPKGVMLSYRAVYNILMNTQEGCGYHQETIMLLPLPLHHSFGLRVLRAVLYSGGCVVLQNGFGFARETLNNIGTFHCNAMALVPASYEVLKDQMGDAFSKILSGLSSIEVGAGSLLAGQRREITGLLPDTQIWNVWGSSESGGAIFCDVNKMCRREDAVSSLGRALKDRVEVRFLNEKAPIGEPGLNGRLSDYYLEKTDAEHPGRMVLRGGMIMSGYWKDEKNTAAALTDGWLITGDMAYQDGEGNIFMLGRADDLINMGGEKISPIEIENIADQYEQIRECACVGVPDQRLGQMPVLFLKAGPGYEESEFQKWLSGKIERIRQPQRMITLDAIPRSRIGKVDRKALRELWYKMAQQEAPRNNGGEQ